MENGFIRLPHNPGMDIVIKYSNKEMKKMIDMAFYNYKYNIVYTGK